MSDNRTSASLTVPCAHLRHKGMYVLSEPDEHETSYYDKYDARVFWCTCTQKPYGPTAAPRTPIPAATGEIVASKTS